MYAKPFFYLLVLPIRLSFSVPISPAVDNSIIENTGQNVNNGTSALVPDLAIIGLGMTGVPVMLENRKLLESLKIPRSQTSRMWMWMSSM